MKETVINVRAARKTLVLIDTAAEAEGKTRSEFLRESAMREAVEVLKKHKQHKCPLCGQKRKEP